MVQELERLHRTERKDHWEMPLFPQSKPLSYYLYVLKRQWRLFVVVSFAIIVGTAVYTFTATPYFRSQGLLEIKYADSSKRNENLEGAPEATEFKRYYSTQQEVLKSRSLLEDLIRNMDLENSSEFSSGRSFLSGILGIFQSNKAPGTVDRLNDLVKQLQNRILVQPVKNSGLISVSIDSTNALLASQMLRTHFDLALERNLQKRRQESLDSRDWLKKELEAIKVQMANAEGAMMKFTAKHNIITSEDGRIRTSLELITKTTESAVRGIEKRARMESLKSVEGDADLLDPLPSEIRVEYLDKVKQELALLEADYAEKAAIYSTDYPKMVVLASKIETLRNKLAKAQNRTVATVTDSARKEEEALQRALKVAKDQAIQIATLGADYVLLRKHVDSCRYLYDELLRRIKEMEIKASATVNNLAVVDPPSIPSKPVRPNKVVYMLLGLILALTSGFFAALLAQNADKTLQTSGESRRLLGLPTLGVLPDLNRLGRFHRDRSTSVPNEFVAIHCPTSPMSDAVKNVKTSLQHSITQSRPRVILISSAIPGEGKTFVTVSLACVFALNKRTKVLIVDADLRWPRMHRVFDGGTTNTGLVWLLETKQPDLRKAIHQSSIPNLSYIPATPRPEHPTILLESPRMSAMLDKLKVSFDFILIDCPPLLGLPDARVVAAHADDIIIVAQQGRVQIKELQACLEFIPDHHRSKLVGLVLNRADPKFSGTAGGYYYPDSYYH